MDPTIIITIISATAISVLAASSFYQSRTLRRQMRFNAILKPMDDLDDEQARKFSLKNSSVVVRK